MRAGGGQDSSAPGSVPTSRRFVIFGGGALVMLLVPTFIALGQWQWHKAAVKEARQTLLDARAAEPPVQLAATAADPESMRYRRIVVRGVYEPERQILIDNRVHQERPGYHVVTPLRIDSGSGGVNAQASENSRVLVNRGWIAAGPDRRQLPVIDTPTGTVELQATAIVPGTRFFTLGDDGAAARWNGAQPAVWQNLDLARYRAAVDFPLQPVVLHLDPDSAGGGFVRDWPRPNERIERHVGYAWQWFGFAAATLGIWLFFLFRLWRQQR